jgi:hypothetical protein
MHTVMSMLHLKLQDPAMENLEETCVDSDLSTTTIFLRGLPRCQVVCASILRHTSPFWCDADTVRLEIDATTYLPTELINLCLCLVGLNS